ncbi:MAG TPA: VWA domain-containing protein [Candidatus Binatia bacterium]|nr:VWA domain-containing protein [Candidatus Binatia bacterium]
MDAFPKGDVSALLLFWSKYAIYCPAISHAKDPRNHIRGKAPPCDDSLRQEGVSMCSRSWLRIRPQHILAALVCILLLDSHRSWAAPTNVELIIDDSGSMAQRIEGQSKIAIAKEVLAGLIQDLPSDAQIAVRTYGRAHPSCAKDCGDMELLTPFGQNSPDRVLPAVKALKPNGMTPIAASLEATAKDFQGKEGQNNLIVLLTDGEEDCNGDPCAASKAIHEAGIHLQVNVIGFNVTGKERPQLCNASPMPAEENITTPRTRLS